MMLDILVGLAMAGAMPFAQDGGVTVTAEKEKPNRRVCKRAVATGSVMPKVTCRTAAEWTAEREKSLAAMELARGDERWRQASRVEKDLLPKDDSAPR